MQQIATTYHLKPHFKQAYILSVEKKEWAMSEVEHEIKEKE